jgi:hypothetical protein
VVELANRVLRVFYSISEMVMASMYMNFPSYSARRSESGGEGVSGGGRRARQREGRDGGNAERLGMATTKGRSGEIKWDTRN